jgi:hypothetical protein
MRSSIVFLITLMLSMRAAHADTNVKTLIKQLSDSSEKIRLAAAINLAKLADQEAVLPLAKSVVGDDDASVRAAAAVALGKTVNASTKESIKKLAVANLKTAAANDRSSTVKSQAEKALQTITGSGGGGGGGGGSGGGGAGGIYVNIGPMSSKTTSSANAKLRALMVKTTEKTLAKVASNMKTTWSGGTPNKATLTKQGVAGFYVDGTLNVLDIKTSGGGATISCKVSMLLADFPDKSVFGFLNGGASVTASSSKTDQDLASEDCVTAVIENLIANKIVPTIKSKVP